MIEQITMKAPATRTRKPIQEKSIQEELSHTKRVPTRIHRVVYPDSDGEPMADSDNQYDAMTDSKFAVINFHKNHPMVYVAANLFIYYEQGDPKKRIAPDLFVVFGVPNRNRGSYKLWLEQKLPAIVFEIASPGTWKKDLQKKTTYEELRIPEYIMLDPFGDFFDDVIIGYRYQNGRYQPIPYLTSEDGKGVYSEQLKLEIWSMPGPSGEANYIFRFRDPRTGEWLLSQLETEAARILEAEARTKAEAEAEAEAKARAKAEAEAEAEAKARAKAEAKAEAEAKERVKAEAKAEAESEARLKLQAEKEALEAELKRLRQELGRT